MIKSNSEIPFHTWARSHRGTRAGHRTRRGIKKKSSPLFVDPSLTAPRFTDVATWALEPITGNWGRTGTWCWTGHRKGMCEARGQRGRRARRAEEVQGGLSGTRDLILFRKSENKRTICTSCRKPWKGTQALYPIRMNLYWQSKKLIVHARKAAP